MKKILYIATIPDWGGAQSYIYDLAKNLKGEFETMVATGYGETAELKSICEKNNISFTRIRYLTREINPVKDLLAIFAIKQLIDKVKPDIVHLNSSKAGVLGAFGAHLAKCRPKIIYTAHGWVFLEPLNPIKKNLYVFLEKLSAKYKDKIIVLGQKDYDLAIAKKIAPKKKLQIIHNAAPEIKFYQKEEARKLLSLPKDKKIVGIIANFYPSKGLLPFIKALSDFKNEDFLFVIIGEGPEKKDAEELIKKLAIKNCLLLGHINDASKYFKAFDIFLLPSLKEGSPYTILEAMQAELPIVATDVGNIKDMLKEYEPKNILELNNYQELFIALQLIKQKLEKTNFISGFEYFISSTKNIYNNLEL